MPRCFDAALLRAYWSAPGRLQRQALGQNADVAEKKKISAVD
jgi:hypothetical protein